MKTMGRTILTCAAALAMFGALALAATDITSQVEIKSSGFGRHRATGIWAATLTVTNNTAKQIDGPIQVVIKELSPTAKMANSNGTVNGEPYITVSTKPLPAKASVQVAIQFENPTNDFINFKTAAFSGTLP